MRERLEELGIDPDESVKSTAHLSHCNIWSRVSVYLPA